MTRPKVPEDKRQRTAQACDTCKRRKQKVSVTFSSHIPCLPPSEPTGSRAGTQMIPSPRAHSFFPCSDCIVALPPFSFPSLPPFSSSQSLSY
ncbi:hypothetical protein CMUS01_06217 [Colletotrichum musicola]|uniref:Uncharacterized protein n=1 Tax=Colletotrichum musicola TaxID=2175873 RepID=A0A8H6NJ15_9PEZI|nr:hypothetical protein CMUS01_06217 [Colletotrichum musicola]